MDRDLGSIRREDCKVMTRRAPTEKEWQDLLFAWKVVKHVKSNAIVFAAGDRTLAIGGGQTSRVESVKIARMKARFPLAGSSVGSDAFFPFPDGVEEIIAAGATAIIQPGGSVRDAEVVAVAPAGRRVADLRLDNAGSDAVGRWMVSAQLLEGNLSGRDDTLALTLSQPLRHPQAVRVAALG